MAATTEELEAFIKVDVKKELEKAPTEKLNVDEIKTTLTTLHADVENGNLKKITLTKEIFEKIRKSLKETVKSMEKNPSLFSRAAEFWGELPLWQKILGGLALTVPTLVIGIMAHIGFLLAICGVTVVTYAGGGIILDDHHKCSTSAVESLQKGILGLADLLELTINALEVIREQLALEIEKFVKENEKLSESITLLSTQIDAIDVQVRATVTMTETISETKDGLVRTAGSLKENIAKQGDLLEQNQHKLKRITEAYTASQSELASKISEISRVKKELEAEVQRAKSIVDTLHASIADLTNVAIGDEEQKRLFKEKLDAFLNDKETSFHQITDRICAAEQKLALVQKELERANSRYQELLVIQGKHLDRLEGLGAPSPLPETPARKALETMGLYAIKGTHHTDSADPDLETTLKYK